MVLDFFRTLRDTSLLRTVLESTNAGVFALDGAGRCTFVNPAGAAMLGVNSEDVLGVDFHALAHAGPTGCAAHLPEDCPVAGVALSEPHVVMADEVFWRRDGTCFTAELTASPILSHDAVTGSVLVVHDITLRRQAEAALRESEQRFRVMADTAPVLIWVSGPDKGCTYFNRGWLEFRGRALEQELGNGWVDGVHPDDAARVRGTYSSAFETRQPYRLEYRLRRADGAYRWILVSGTPRYAVDGTLAGYVGSCVDITERRVAEQERDSLLAEERAAREQAEAATRQRDELLALVSHDLRSPLATIRGRAQLLRRRVAARAADPEREPLLKGLEQIEAGTERMTGQIDELLDLAQLQAGRPLDLDRRPTDLVDLARQAIAEHQASTEQHRIQLQTAEPVVSGAWDDRRLRRVLDNLLTNAIKYSPSGGVILLKVDVAAERAVLQVRDHGVGIPSRELPRVFERFYRASNAVGQATGSGIGLAGVRQIVEQHGGTISVESEEEHGTTFIVYLPLTGQGSSR
jgi:PAS domain S-box-containing protein